MYLRDGRDQSVIHESGVPVPYGVRQRILYAQVGRDSSVQNASALYTPNSPVYRNLLSKPSLGSGHN